MGREKGLWHREVQKLRSWEQHLSTGLPSRLSEAISGPVSGLPLRRAAALLKMALAVLRASLVAQMLKDLPVRWGDLGLIPGLGRCPGERQGNPPQHTPVALPGESHG